MVPSPYTLDICQNCSEVILSVFILRHDTSNRPVEQQVYPTFCPLCGAKLIRKQTKMKEGNS